MRNRSRVAMCSAKAASDGNRAHPATALARSAGLSLGVRARVVNRRWVTSASTPGVLWRARECSSAYILQNAATPRWTFSPSPSAASVRQTPAGRCASDGPSRCRHRCVGRPRRSMGPAPRRVAAAAPSTAGHYIPDRSAVVPAILAEPKGDLVAREFDLQHRRDTHWHGTGRGCRLGASRAVEAAQSSLRSDGLLLRDSRHDTSAAGVDQDARA